MQDYRRVSNLVGRPSLIAHFANISIYIHVYTMTRANKAKCKVKKKMSLGKWKGFIECLFWDTKSKKFSSRDGTFNEANMLKKEVNELTFREDWLFKWTIDMVLKEMHNPISQTQDEEENQETPMLVMVKKDILLKHPRKMVAWYHLLY